jgi:hypothetical protein
MGDCRPRTGPRPAGAGLPVRPMPSEEIYIALPAGARRRARSRPRHLTPPGGADLIRASYGQGLSALSPGRRNIQKMTHERPRTLARGAVPDLSGRTGRAVGGMDGTMRCRSASARSPRAPPHTGRTAAGSSAARGVVATGAQPSASARVATGLDARAHDPTPASAAQLTNPSPLARIDTNPDIGQATCDEDLDTSTPNLAATRHRRRLYSLSRDSRATGPRISRSPIRAGIRRTSPTTRQRSQVRTRPTPQRSA